MKRIYCIKCNKHRKFKKLKISYLLHKTLTLYLICVKCSSKSEIIFKEEESTEILTILGLINNIEEYQMNI